MPTQIFVNLPVKDLAKSKGFFAKLGFTFNPQFTDENAACMIVDEDHIYVMLLLEKFFTRFTKRDIADAKKVTEAINAISTDSREKVDEFASKAVEAGGKIHRDPEDHGWMYNQSIEDLDGHIWEILYMDESKMPKNPKAAI